MIECLAQGNKTELILLESELTISKAMNEGTTLTSIEHEIGRKNLSVILSGLINRQSEFFNYKKNITDEQSLYAAFDLIDMFAYDKFEDIVMMFKMARKGELGNTYQRLDYETILNVWAKNYLELKAETREREISRKKDEAEQESKAKLGSEVFSDISKKLEKDKAKEAEENPTPVISPINEQFKKLKEAVKALSDEELLSQELRARSEKSNSLNAFRSWSILVEEKQKRMLISNTSQVVNMPKGEQSEVDDTTFTDNNPD